MNDKHPITPPPKLVRQWWVDAQVNLSPNTLCWVNHVAAAATQWGADQELEACCELLEVHGYKGTAIDLRTARRPNPPSLKDQALDELTSAERLYPADWSTIRRALEALPE
jgi:hypothetical protein